MWKTIDHGDRARPPYYIHDGCSALRLELAGFLTAEGTAEIEACWRTASSTLAGRAFVIDLDHLTGAGEEGHRLLRRWHLLGAQFLATSSAARVVVDSITGHQLPQVALPSSTELGLSCRIGAIPVVAALTLLLAVTVWAAGSSGSSSAAAIGCANALHSRLENASSVCNCQSLHAGASFMESK